jgi:hypothetical protein
LKALSHLNGRLFYAGEDVAAIINNLTYSTVADRRLLRLVE